MTPCRPFLWLGFLLAPVLGSSREATKLRPEGPVESRGAQAPLWALPATPAGGLAWRIPYPIIGATGTRVCLLGPHGLETRPAGRGAPAEPLFPDVSATQGWGDPHGGGLLLKLRQGECLFWDGKSSRRVSLAGSANLSPTVVAFAPALQRILAAEGSIARVWDTSTGTLVCHFSLHLGPILAVEISPAGLVASTSHDGRTAVWNLQDASLAGHWEGTVGTGARFVQHGTLLAIPGRDRILRLAPISRESPDEAEVELAAHEGEISNLTTSRDGTLLASGGKDGRIAVWGLGPVRQIAEARGESPVLALAFSPDGLRLAAAFATGRIQIFEAATGLCLQAFESGAPPADLRFLGHGEHLAAVDGDGNTTVWQSGGDGCSEIWRTSAPGFAHDFQLAPSGRFAVAGYPSGIARIRLATSPPMQLALQGHTGAITSVTLGKTEATVLTTSRDQTARLWDVASGKCTAILSGHTGPVFTGDVSPDGSTAATASADGTVRIWRTSDGQCQHVFKGHAGLIWGARFAPHGSVIASWSEDGVVRIWDAQTGESRQQLKAKDAVLNFAFGPDGMLAAATRRGSILCWRDNGTLAWQQSGHRGRTTKLKFDPLGLHLMSAGEDGRILVWSAGDGGMLAELAHPLAVSDAEFSLPSMLATSSVDGVWRLWNLDSRRVQAVLSLAGGGGLKCTYAAGGLHAASFADGTIRFHRWPYPERIPWAAPNWFADLTAWANPGQATGTAPEERARVAGRLQEAAAADPGPWSETAQWHLDPSQPQRRSSLQDARKLRERADDLCQGELQEDTVTNLLLLDPTHPLLPLVASQAEKNALQSVKLRALACERIVDEASPETMRRAAALLSRWGDEVRSQQIAKSIVLIEPTLRK